MAKIKSSSNKGAISIVPMNEPEKQSAQAADEKALKDGAQAEKLNLMLGMVSTKFNLDDTYSVSGFSDKGKQISITVANAEFVVSVTVKDSERHGLNTQ